MNRSVPILAITVLALTASALARGEDGGGTVQGGATTIIAGGTGAPSFVPVITKLAFHWRNGQGHFECLALAPTSAAAGKPGSGINGSVAVLTGSATVTGLGAGTNVPFTAAAERGGPGTTFVLTISGLTFHETILEGEISF
ncbi:MAG: hypothetical protein E6K32_19125 [Gammaproteobacteria bacterium]|nr:MAG: hypothetical protein E6K32_19125 [Gammaproteobacteria bacterium]